MVEPMASTQDSSKSNDLLDLFDFNNNANGNNNNNNNDKSKSAKQAQPNLLKATTTPINSDNFLDDLFDSSPPKQNNKPRNTMNTLQIDPKLMQQRESRSLQPDELFDVSMWS